MKRENKIFHIGEAPNDRFYMCMRSRRLNLIYTRRVMYSTMLSRCRVQWSSSIAKPRCLLWGKRGIITGHGKTGSNAVPKTGNVSGEEKSKSSSGSPFDSSFSFQLFLIVGAMGAGYTLGKTAIETSPPVTLFPNGSTTGYEDLKEFEKVDKERLQKRYDMFRRCALRILENKGIEVDMKYGKNEFLFEEKYCSKDVSQIMNEPDEIGDVFFGKDVKEFKDKEFVWYPETTEDVSAILKTCDEFKVPVNSKSSRVPSIGLTFSIDFSNFDKSDDSDNKIALTCNMTNEEIKAKLKNTFDLNNRLDALDLFFIDCGLKLSSSNNKLINNRFDSKDVDEIECVLPDGNIINVRNDINDKDNYKLYQLLTTFQDDVAIITKAYIDKSKRVDQHSAADEKSLIVIGANDMSQLQNLIKEIKHKVNEEVAIVDNNGCLQILDRFGEYRTFAIVKTDNTTLTKLNKKFQNGLVVADGCRIESLPVSMVGNPALQSGYLSDCVTSGGNGVLVKETLSATQVKAYYVTSPVAETKVVDPQSTLRSVLRRLKLAMDNGRILNSGSAVATVSTSNM